MSDETLALGSVRVPRAGERVLAVANFLCTFRKHIWKERLFRRDAAVTDAKHRPGFPTSTRDACRSPQKP